MIYCDGSGELDGYPDDLAVYPDGQLYGDYGIAPLAIAGTIGAGKKVVQGITGIFKGRSSYTFVPGKPPGAFRGRAAMDEYNRRMAALKASGQLPSKPHITPPLPGPIVISKPNITPGKLTPEGEAAAAAGQPITPVMMQSSGTGGSASQPSWVTPALIGAGILGLVFVFSGRSKGGQQL